MPLACRRISTSFSSRVFVTGQIKASDVIDVSFARKASAELGPYQRKSP